jgi:hypothetical protein
MKPEYNIIKVSALHSFKTSTPRYPLMVITLPKEKVSHPKIFKIVLLTYTTEMDRNSSSFPFGSKNRS